MELTLAAVQARVEGQSVLVELLVEALAAAGVELESDELEADPPRASFL